jgi:hypothetical protein
MAKDIAWYVLRAAKPGAWLMKEMSHSPSYMEREDGNS